VKLRNAKQRKARLQGAKAQLDEMQEKRGSRKDVSANAALAEAFRPHLSNKLVAEGVAKIRDKFQSVAHVGPVSCADFEEITDREDREVRARDAFERVDDLLQRLGIV